MYLIEGFAPKSQHVAIRPDWLGRRFFRERGGDSRRMTAPPSLTRFWTFPESLAGNGRGYRCVLIGQQVANVHRVESRLQLFQHDGRIAGGNGVLVSFFGGLLFYHYPLQHPPAYFYLQVEQNRIARQISEEPIAAVRATRLCPLARSSRLPAV